MFVASAGRYLDDIKMNLSDQISKQFFSELAGNDQLKKLVYAFIGTQHPVYFSYNQNLPEFCQAFGTELIRI